jgi:hypothetical protein
LEFDKLKIFIVNYSNFILVFLSFFLIVSLGYGLSFTSFLISFLFILSLWLPYLIIKTLAKGEINYIFVPFILKKIDFKSAYDTDYLKEFPCWFICNLVLSSITFFKLPIFIPGRFVFIGWINPLKVYKDNSENEIISQHFFIVIFFNILFSLALYLIYPSFYALIPMLVNIYLLIPIPGNFGLDFYSMDFSKWLKASIINIILFITLFFAILIFKGIELSKTQITF